MLITLTSLVTMLRTADAALYAVFFLFSIVFLALLVPCHPYPGSFLIKALPALSLAALAARNLKNIQGALLFTGLIFSAAGDIALDLDRDRYFIAGLAFFLAAHIFYILAMTREFRWERSRVIPALLIASFSAAIALLLRDIPGSMLRPVMAYLLVITLMVLSALFRAGGSRVILAGAILFMASDTIIAVNKFITPIPLSMLFNIGTYFIAQLLIVTGFIIGSGRRKGKPAASEPARTE